MPVLENLELTIDADAVMRGQGADPAVLRLRRPALANLAEQALQEGLPLIEPSVIYKTFPVQEVRHERLIFAGGGQLSGKLIAHHLAQARLVHVLLCSIGDSLERYAAEVWSSSAVYSLALDGVGRPRWRPWQTPPAGGSKTGRWSKVGKARSRSAREWWTGRWKKPSRRSSICSRMSRYRSA